VAVGYYISRRGVTVALTGVERGLAFLYIWYESARHMCSLEKLRIVKHHMS
jgi:hypothetical protein